MHDFIGWLDGISLLFFPFFWLYSFLLSSLLQCSHIFLLASWLLWALQFKHTCEQSNLVHTYERKHVIFVCLGLSYLTPNDYFHFHPQIWWFRNCIFLYNQKIIFFKIYHIFTIHSQADRQQGWSYLLVVVNGAAINMFMQFLSIRLEIHWVYAQD